MTKTPPRKNTETAAVQTKLINARAVLNKCLIDRDSEIDVVLSSLVAGENPLLVGPPGTGKSMLLDAVMRLLGGGSRFSVLMTKFTQPEEVFGPVDVTGLKAGVYRRITTGKLPEADVAFLDEIFKASSAILNTTLRILNERVYENGDGVFRRVPLLLCVAASNEWPGEDGGKELGALFDRFLFRKAVRPIQSKQGRKRLLWSDPSLLEPTFPDPLTPAEVKHAQTTAAALPWSPEARDGLEMLVGKLNEEGIFPGDRRLRKSVGAARAYAYVCGDSEVHTRHLEILSHVLWDDPQEQPDKVAKIVGRVANPVGLMIHEKLLAAESVSREASPADAVPKLQAIRRDLLKLADHPTRDKAAEQVQQMIKDAYRQVVGDQE